MPASKDLFSATAAEYSRYRPVYPRALFEHLSGLVSARECAWDCATGNGQAALELARDFKQVLATDLSARQLAQAAQHERVRYSVGTAEQSGLDSGAADLVTAAQAFHWFDHPRFYDEVRRVARPAGAVLAVWSYALAYVCPEVDAVVARYYEELVGPYWEPERRIVENGYRDIAVPFSELAAPRLEMKALWSLEHLKGYLGTWSATQAALRATGVDPIGQIAGELERAWGGVAAREIRWPLAVRAFRIG